MLNININNVRFIAPISFVSVSLPNITTRVRRLRIKSDIRPFADCVECADGRREAAVPSVR